MLGWFPGTNGTRWNAALPGASASVVIIIHRELEDRGGDVVLGGNDQEAHFGGLHGGKTRAPAFARGFPAERVAPLDAVQVLDLVLLDTGVELPQGDAVEAGRLAEIQLQPRAGPVAHGGVPAGGGVAIVGQGGVVIVAIVARSGCRFALREVDPARRAGCRWN